MTDLPGFTEKQWRSIGGATAQANLQQINLWHGAIRSGKTIGSLVKFLMAIAKAPTTGEIVLIGRTRDTVFRNIIGPMMDVTIFGMFVGHIEYNRGAPTAKILGRTVHVIGSSDARAENVIRGLTVSVAYVDEVSLVAEEFFNQLMGRCSAPGAQVFCTTNPGGPSHWLKKQWIDRAEERGHKVFHFSLEDNREFLPEGLIESYYAQYTGLWRKRMIDGLWSVAAGAIYDMFDPDRHVVAELPPMQRFLACGIDFGVQHPTRGQLLGLGVDSNLYVIAEWTPPKGTEAERATSLTHFYQLHGVPEFTFIDPGGGGAGLILQVHQSGIPNVFNAMKDVLDGIGIVAALLSAGRLFISDTCTELIDELPGYSWDEKKADKGEDAPVKADDDNVDALRYAIFSSRIMWQSYIDLHEATRQPDNQLEGVAL
jgi:phage terminase large subunit